ncbi:hypothetical protein FRC11_002905, partial [Ceratobasidium sp. 423]
MRFLSIAALTGLLTTSVYAHTISSVKTVIPIPPTSRSVPPASLVLSGLVVDVKIAPPDTTAWVVMILATPALQAPVLARASRAAFASQASTAPLE